MPHRQENEGQDPSLEALLRHHYRQLAAPEAPVYRWVAHAKTSSPTPFRFTGRRPRLALVLVLLAGLGSSLFQWAPRVDALAWAATHNTPVLDQIARRLSVPGLNSLVGSGKIIPLNVTDRRNGVAVQVVGAYADAAQTLVFLRSTKGILALSPEGITLQDQFGQTLVPNFSAWSDTRHEGYVQFSALPSWVWVPGVRLTLTLNSLQTMSPLNAVQSGPTSPIQAVYKGPWRLTWVQAPPSSSHTVYLRAGARAQGVSFTLHRILLAPSAAVLHLSSSIPAHFTTPAQAKTLKGRGPQFSIQEVGTNKTIQIFSGSGAGTRETLMTVPLPAGRYILAILWWNQKTGPWKVRFTIPHSHP